MVPFHWHRPWHRPWRPRSRRQSSPWKWRKQKKRSASAKIWSWDESRVIWEKYWKDLSSCNRYRMYRLWETDNRWLQVKVGDTDIYTKNMYYVFYMCFHHSIVNIILLIGWQWLWLIDTEICLCLVGCWKLGALRTLAQTMFQCR